jgi:hypothetical protein
MVPVNKMSITWWNGWIIWARNLSIEGYDNYTISSAQKDNRKKLQICKVLNRLAEEGEHVFGFRCWDVYLPASGRFALVPL